MNPVNHPPRIWLCIYYIFVINIFAKACQYKSRDRWESFSELLQHSSSSVFLSVSQLARGCCRPRTPAFLQFTFRIVHLSTSTHFIPSRFQFKRHTVKSSVSRQQHHWKPNLWQSRRDVSGWLKIRKSPWSHAVQHVPLLFIVFIVRLCANVFYRV